MAATSVDAFAQNSLLGRGVNILGYDPIWRNRQEARMQAKHFHMIREAGFDHVRINLHPFKFMGPGPEHAIAPSWLEVLDWAVKQSLDNQLMVILDLHEFGALGENLQRYWPQFLAAWKQIATRFQQAPSTVLFEMLNEPNKALTAEMWNSYLREPYALLRETNPDRTLIIGPANWNGIEHLEALALPEDDRNIIVTVHYYHPMPFTHQGAAWTEFHENLGVHWEGTPEERQAVDRQLAVGQDWAKRFHRTLYLGEFGAYDRADMPSRVRYTNYIARAAEALGWSWGYWQFDSDFVVYDIPRDGWVEPIRDALIPAEVRPVG